MDRKTGVKETHTRFNIMIKYRNIPHSGILKKSNCRHLMIFVK